MFGGSVNLKSPTLRIPPRSRGEDVNHASLVDTRLVTTPTLLSVFVRTGQLTSEEARALLDDVSVTRSWDANSYVKRARSLLDDA